MTSRNRFVAVADGRVVGMVGCAESTYSGVADLTSLWVDPIARGRGVGDRLVTAVVEWAKEAGFVQVLLAVKVGNSRAEALYARNGFIRIDTATRADEFEMSLRL